MSEKRINQVAHMQKGIKVHTPSFKEKAVLLSYKNKNLAKLERDLGLYAGALRKWQKAYEKLDKESFTEINIGEQKIREIERKIKKSDLELEILKSAGEHLYHGKPMIFYFMSNNEKTYSIRLMSKVFNTNRSTYRKWKHQHSGEEQKRNALVKQEITSIFFANHQRYGKRRIAAVLQNSGCKISSSTVGRYMRELNLYSEVKKQTVLRLKSARDTFFVEKS